MIIVVTGSRYLENPGPVHSALLQYVPKEDAQDKSRILFHGGQRGVDLFAADFAEGHSWKTVCVPYASELGAQGGPVRNAEMLCRATRAASRERGKSAVMRIVVLAFPAPDSKGTLNCAAIARLLGLRVVRYPLGGPLG